MNLRNAAVIVSFLTLSILLSCSEDEGDDNEIFDPTSEYYIQFKANGKLKTYEADDVPFNGGGELATCNIPPDTDKFAGIQMTNVIETITAAQIESWANTTFTFDSSEPRPGFFFQGKEFYFSGSAEAPSLTMSITTVEFIGTRQILDNPEKRLYKVTGTFNCEASNADGSKKITVTNGRFVVGFAEG